jgi:hypothetical protein
MIKKFKYNKLIVEVKTNYTKAGCAYFNDIDIQGEVEKSYKATEYKNGHNCPPDIFVVDVYNMLKDSNIKAHKIELENIIYKGEKLTDFTNQTTLKDKK